MCSTSYLNAVPEDGLGTHTDIDPDRLKFGVRLQRVPVELGVGVRAIFSYGAALGTYVLHP